MPSQITTINSIKTRITGTGISISGSSTPETTTSIVAKLAGATPEAGKIGEEYLPTTPITILAMGESTMARQGVGYGFSPATSDTELLPNLFILQDSTSSFVPWDVTQPAQNSHLGGNGSSPQNLTMAYYFARRVALETGRRVQVIASATNGVAIGQWAASNGMWQRMIQQVAAASASRVDMILWSNGINDSQFNTTEGYRDALIDLMTRVRALSWFSDSAPWFAVNVPAQYANIHQSYRFFVNNRNYPHIHVADTTGRALADGIHWTSIETAEIGNKDLWSLYKSYSSPITAEFIGAETPAGAQAKADLAQQNAITSALSQVANAASAAPLQAIALDTLGVTPALWIKARNDSSIYDAPTGGSLVAPNGSVARIEDKSGNNRHIIQSIAASRPQYILNAINGKPALRFDGVNDFMAVDNVGLSSRSDFTLFVVHRHINIGQGENIAGFNIDNNVKPTGSPILMTYGGNVFGVYNTGVDGNQVGLNLTATGGHLIPRVSMVRRGGGNALQNGATITVRSNDAIVTGNQNWDSTEFIERLQIGGRQENTLPSFNGDISEVILIPRVITDTEVDKIYNYLYAEWGFISPETTAGAQAKADAAQAAATNQSLWLNLKERWDVEPTQISTIAAGQVWEYTLKGVTRYRLVPTPYIASNDAFYTTWNGTTLSGIIIRRND